MSGCSSGNKRQRVEEEKQVEIDVKLSEELRELMGGRKYIKEEELTRAVLLEWAKKRQGAVKEVNLISITVQSMGGTESEVKLEDSDNTVRSLKQNIQDSQGIASFNQQLFLVSKKSGGETEASVDAKQEPMGDDQLIVVDCCVALCIDTEEENCWDSSSPLISVSIALIVFLSLLNLTGTFSAFRTRCLLLAAKAVASLPRFSARMPVITIAFGQIESWNLANVG
jgi:hypothetical protein